MAEEESQARQKKNEERREKECYGRKRGSSLYYILHSGKLMSNIYQSKAQFICNQFLDDPGRRGEPSMPKKDKERCEKNLMAEREAAHCTVEKLVSIISFCFISP